MFELGHRIAQALLPQGKKTITVRLVLPNADLLANYKQLFEQKQAQINPRISIEWLSISAMKKQLLDSPSFFAKDVLVVDEGDTILEQEVNHQLSLCSPKQLVLLSAVPREAWNGAQKLCFSTVKGRKGKYLDASCVFPAQRRDRANLEPELLPEGCSEILNLAIKIAKKQPVLFWGKSSVYAGLKAWPKD